MAQVLPDTNFIVLRNYQMLNAAIIYTNFFQFKTSLD